MQLSSYHLLSCLLMEWQHRFHHHILALCTFFQDFHLKKKTKDKSWIVWIFLLINLVLELVVSLQKLWVMVQSLKHVAAIQMTGGGKRKGE